MSIEPWHYTARMHDEGRIGLRLPGTEHVVSPEEAETLAASINALLGASRETTVPGLSQLMAKIRLQAQKALDPDLSTIKDELSALDWQLSEIARILHEVAKCRDETGRVGLIASARRCLDRAVQRSYRATQLHEGLRVFKA